MLLQKGAVNCCENKIAVGCPLLNSEPPTLRLGAGLLSCGSCPSDATVPPSDP